MGQVNASQGQQAWMNRMEGYLQTIQQGSQGEPAKAQGAVAQAVGGSQGFLPQDHVKLPNIQGASIKCRCVDFFGPNPKQLINDIRSAQGGARLNGLLEFQGQLDKMSKSQLTDAQNYLVELMADPFNKDDELLGAMLKTVNKELNSRDGGGIKLEPRIKPTPFEPTPRVLNPSPFDGKDFPRMLD